MTKPYFIIPQNEVDLQWKTTPNGKQPQNIKSGISQLVVGGGAHLFLYTSSGWVKKRLHTEI